jgi:photosystem II PsbU protein
MIVTGGPYQKVEDVLKLPDLDARQKELLKANLDRFTVNPQMVPVERRMPRRKLGHG